MFTCIRREIAFFLCVLAFSLLFTVAESTSTTTTGQLSVSLSKTSGFYDESFYLEMDASGGKIYYTLDSTDPNEDSIQYTGPILIEDASDNRNVYSTIEEVCLDFSDDLLDEIGNTYRYGYSVPTESVDKATVVKAVCIDDDGNKSVVSTGIYFVGFQDKPGYEGMNVVSVVTDPENLFDYDTGIYVTGAIFDKAWQSGKIEARNKVDTNIGCFSANYTQKGKEWERMSYISFFDSDRNQLLSGNYGIRIQGGSSRGMAEKSLNIFAREEYGTACIPGELLFGMDCNLGSVNLYSGGQAAGTKLNDYLVNNLACELDVATRINMPYALFLNGEYWGWYWLQPRFEEEYFQYVYGVYGENVVSVKHDSLEIGHKDDLTLYQAMFSFISEENMGVNENYEEAAGLIDVKSFIDYYATEIYIANMDWPWGNDAKWRTRNKANSEYSDGKWRWILFDVNLSMSSEAWDLDMVQWAANRDDVFASLLENDDFRSRLYSRLVELADTVFEPGRVSDFIDEYELVYQSPMELEYERFYGEKRSIDSFISGCEDIRTFFEKRHDYVLETYGEDR